MPDVPLILLTVSLNGLPSYLWTIGPHDRSYPPIILPHCHCRHSVVRWRASIYLQIIYRFANCWGFLHKVSSRYPPKQWQSGSNWEIHEKLICASWTGKSTDTILILQYTLAADIRRNILLMNRLRGISCTFYK